MIVIALAISFMPRPVMVDLVDVQPGPLVVTLDEEGETRVHDVYTLSAPVAGRVQRIDRHVGDPVAANDVPQFRRPRLREILPQPRSRTPKHNTSLRVRNTRACRS
jgi:HlyD family secretion protein